MGRGAPSIDDLVAQAIAAVNSGDLDTAHKLADQVLAADASNADAESLLSAVEAATGELRRLTMLFCDLVGSTELSHRQDPERYRRIIRRYLSRARQIIEERYEGYVQTVKGDGILAVFGYPAAHEDDAWRAVMSGLDLASEIRETSDPRDAEPGEGLSVRVAVHKGLVYLDTEADDVFGLAANVASRLHGLAEPGTVLVSDSIRRLVHDRFELRDEGLRKVKGLDDPVASWVVVGPLDSRRTHERQWMSPLIGRDRELDLLRQMWRSRPGAVLLRGEAGVGKSRLSAAIASEVADEAQIIEIHGSPAHTSVGFHPLRELLESECGLRRTDDGVERLRRLRRHVTERGLDEDLVPFLGLVLDIAPASGYETPRADARKLHELTMDAVCAYMRHHLARRPTLVLAEDVHWFDESTAAALTRLIGARDPDVLFLCTSRTGGQSVSGSHGVIEVEPLSDAEADALVASLDAGNLNESVRSGIVSRADGIPLHIEELVRSALDVPLQTESVIRSEGSTVPDALYEPLCARLYATKSHATVASVAATFGRRIDKDLLSRVVARVDPGVAGIDDALSSLVDGAVLERVADHGDVFRFRHELLREVAYELQPHSVRQRVHGLIADALAARAEGTGADWPILADHFAQAERWEEAARSHDAAAEAARRRGALKEARNHLSRAVEAMGALDPSAEGRRREVEVRLRRGFLAVSAEGYSSPEAAGDFERCLELTMADPGGDELFSTLISLWGYYTARADLRRAVEVLEAVRRQLTGEREWFRPLNTAGFGMIDWFSGRFHEALETLESAAVEAMLPSLDEWLARTWYIPNDPFVAIHTHLAMARFMRGDPQGADVQLAAAEERCAELPFPQGPFSLAYALSYGCLIDIMAGRFDRAAANADRILAIGDAHGFDFWNLVGVTQRAAVAAARGYYEGDVDPPKLAEASSALGGLIPMWEMLDVRILLPAFYTPVAALLARSGDVEGARARIEQSFESADATGVHFYDAETHRVAAHLHTDRAAIERGLRTALDVARKQGALPFELRIAWDIYELVGGEARADLEDVVSRFVPGAAYPELDAVRARLAETP
jgi:class 3 adenylate cyclase/tetratricopeptide (TPR) repeat protein